jgi:hypothetical protein
MPRLVNKQSLQQLFLDRGLVQFLIECAANGQPSQPCAATLIQQFFDQNISDIDLDLVYLDRMVSDGVISTDDKNAIEALAGPVTFSILFVSLGEATPSGSPGKTWRMVTLSRNGEQFTQTFRLDTGTDAQHEAKIRTDISTWAW